MQKKYFVSLIALLTLGLSTIHAQAATPKSNITIQPFGLLFGVANAEYETALSSSSSIAIRGNYYSYKILDAETTGIGGGASYRFYLGKKSQAPKGFYLGPKLDVFNVLGKVGDSEASALFVSGGAEVGYKWIWGEDIGFCLSPSINATYNTGTLEFDDASISNVDWTGIGMGIGVALGVAF